MKREVPSVGLMSELKMAMMIMDPIGERDGRRWMKALVRTDVVADGYKRLD
jgi:hypothetical protein